MQISCCLSHWWIIFVQTSIHNQWTPSEMVLYMTTTICALCFRDLHSLDHFIYILRSTLHLLSANTLSRITSVAKHIVTWIFMLDFSPTRNPAVKVVGLFCLLMKFMWRVQFYTQVSDLFVLIELACLLQFVTKINILDLYNIKFVQ